MATKLTMSPQLKVTTQAVMGSHLLRLAEAEIEAVIAREMVENPALDALGPDWQQSHTQHTHMQSTSNRGSASEAGDAPDAERVLQLESTREQLVQQARVLVPRAEFATVAYLIYSLDEHGLLRLSTETLCEDLNLPLAWIERAINWVQQLDPPGVGARTVRESLLLQCAALESQEPSCDHAKRIIDQAWEAFSHQRWQHVARLTALKLAEVKQAVCFMRDHCSLFPLVLTDGHADDVMLFEPDLIVRRSERATGPSFSVEIPAARAVNLRINPAYLQATSQGCAEPLSASDRTWMEQSVERARGFIHALKQRYATLQQIGTFLVVHQRDFFCLGMRYLKPITRAEAASLIGLHPSTVSRAVNDKVVQLPNGQLIALSALFDTTAAAKEALREILAACATPLSDLELTEQMHARSFALSRRTIAAYRSELGLTRQAVRTQHLGKGHP